MLHNLIFILKKLTSIQNPFVKSLLSLKVKSKQRNLTGTFLIEGEKEIDLAIKGGYVLNKILFYPGICCESTVRKWYQHAELIEISNEIFQKLAYRNSSEGVIGIAEVMNLTLKNLNLGDNPLILIAQSIEKPGNIGAILRTADAANLDAVIIADPKCDLYNPNVIRSSVGCLFTNQIAVGKTTEVLSFLKKNKISIYCATLQNTNFYNTQDYTIPTALVVGAEATGLSQEWRDHATKHIIIPMQGVIDSMNVSVSAAVLMFEARRQRGF